MAKNKKNKQKPQQQQQKPAAPKQQIVTQEIYDDGQSALDESGTVLNAVPETEVNVAEIEAAYVTDGSVTSEDVVKLTADLRKSTKIMNATQKAYETLKETYKNAEKQAKTLIDDATAEASKIKEDENHIVLVNPSNTGNLGTILRTMLGFDFKNLAIIKPAVDMFDPLVVRASMGAVFSINFEYFNNIEEYVSKFSSHHLYPFMLNGKSSVENVKFVEPYSIIHGNESKGLDEKFLEIGESVYIPHSKSIDSLNLSIAAGISMWEASKSKM